MKIRKLNIVILLIMAIILILAFMPLSSVPKPSSSALVGTTTTILYENLSHNVSNSTLVSGNSLTQTNTHK